VTVRILIVEDNLLTRLGITSLIETDPTMKVAAVAEDGARALKLYPQVLPDVVICDLRMPLVDGWQTVALLCQQTPPARVLVLTNLDGEGDIFRALRAGALGYLTKEAEGADVLAAIREVAAGRRHVPPALAARFEARASQQGLNARESQILDHLAQGLSNRRIARELGLSAKTVEMYVSSILGKLGAQSRTDAVVIALARGLLTVKPRPGG
jgi:DNA-binding NarL/FixJ family response regulator